MVVAEQPLAAVDQLAEDAGRGHRVEALRDGCQGQRLAARLGRAPSSSGGGGPAAKLSHLGQGAPEIDRGVQQQALGHRRWLAIAGPDQGLAVDVEQVDLVEAGDDLVQREIVAVAGAQNRQLLARRGRRRRGRPMISSVTRWRCDWKLPQLLGGLPVEVPVKADHLLGQSGRGFAGSADDSDFTPSSGTSKMT